MNSLNTILVTINTLQSDKWNITNSKKMSKGQKVLKNHIVDQKIRNAQKVKSALMAEWLNR